MSIVNINRKVLFVTALLLFHFNSGHAQFKSMVYDFDGLDINQSSLPEGEYGSADLTYRIAANPLAASEMIGDRVLKLNLTWNSGYGVFGRGISRYIEFNPLSDRFNFFFYNPVSNNQSATVDVIITDDDNLSYAFEYASDDRWKKSLVIPGGSGWQLVSIPLKDFTDSNTGGNGIFDISFSSNKGMLLMTEFRFLKASSGLSNPIFYMDLICFSEGVLPHGASIHNLPPKSAGDYCLLGAYQSEPKGQANEIPPDFESLFPSVPGKKLKYANYFLQWGMDGTAVAKELPANDVQILINNGYTPIISWEPMFQGYSRLDPVQPRLDDIIGSEYNAYIDRFADKIKTYTDTVIIRFMHEFEGNWYSWSITHNNQDPSKYVAAFRKVVDRFRARGATKVKWMWCVNGDYYPYRHYNWVVPAYPGDAYVDIVALDSYNDHYPESLPWWRSFKWKTAESYYYLTKYFPSKPLIICEVGCRERFSSENTASESKGQWYARMDKELQSNFHKVRGLVFFNSAPTQNWFVNSSPSALQSLTDNIWYDDYYFKTTSTPPPPPPPSSCSGTGSISREVWNGISGTSISSIPVSSVPSSTGSLTIFEAPASVADNYGQRIRGYICPPATGNYIFWISSDDNSELWLSTNDQVANRQKIASVTGWTSSRQWTKYPSQQSVAKYLIAGQKYYIEALHKEGSQGDHLAVGWQLPNGSQERPVPGSRLLPYTSTPPPPPPPSACSGTGSISREVWNGISGTSISSIPVSSAPSSTGSLAIFEAPASVADNYGQRIRGYICPPATGNYIFWISSDDNSELWLSTNDQVANRQKIASVTGWTSSRQWTKYPSQQSVAKYLTAGQKYYIEALHKEGSQGDHLSVGWQLPNGSQERPVPGSRLIPFQNTASSADLISAGSSWKYLDNGTNQGTAWRNNSFSETGWKTGNAELGYGDGGEATVVSYGTSSTNKYITTYFRKTFSVSEISGITGLELSLIRDDGAVVYLNGTEIYRSNMPSGTIAYNTLATTYIDGTAESSYVIANVGFSNLVAGNNVIAVEIHQNSSSSSDISFNLKLKAIRAASIPDRNVFAVIGDYGFSGPNEASVANLVKSWEPDYIITVGDNNYPDGASATIDANIGQYYHDYIYPYNGTYGPGSGTNKFFPSLGNHDYNTSGAAPYIQYFSLPGNEKYYDFIKNDIHFFAISSDTREAGGTSVTSTQALWLKNKLAASTSKWKVVYFHHSPYCSDQVHGSVAYMQWPFKTWGADAVITGHSHIYERVLKDGFPYFVNGLGGHSKYSLLSTPVSGSQFRYNAAFGAMKVELKNDTLNFRFYNSSYTLIDDYSMIKTAPQRKAECVSTITAGSSTTFCEGGEVTLSSDSLQGYVYQWILNEKEIEGAGASSYTASVDGDYQVKISNNECTAWSAPAKVTVNSSLTARITAGGKTTICKGKGVRLYANTCNDYMYQWKRDGENIPGAVKDTYDASVPGSYQVMIVNGSSVAWSALVGVTAETCETNDSLKNTEANASLNAPLSSGNTSDLFRVSVYPNPTTGLFTFDFCLEDNSETDLEVRVLNSVGQTVYRTPPTRFSGCVNDTIELDSKLSTGVYFLQVRIGNRTENVKILLNR
jgi:beta-mannanase/type IV secretory pathway protease TraF